MIPPDLLPQAVTLTFDLRVVLFCATAALTVGVLFGLAPAWQATSFHPAQTLASGGRATTIRGGRFRSALVAGQMATAVALLFGAGLLLRTLLVVDNVDRGYRAGNALTMIIDPVESKYPTPAARLVFYEAIEREVTSLPGVRGVGWASTLPLGMSYEGQTFFAIAGDPPPPESQTPAADYQIASPSYFRTLDLPIVAGRAFDGRDTTAGAQVCIVNEAFDGAGERLATGTVSTDVRRDSPPAQP